MILISVLFGIFRTLWVMNKTGSGMMTDRNAGVRSSCILLKTYSAGLISISKPAFFNVSVNSSARLRGMCLSSFAGT